MKNVPKKPGRYVEFCNRDSKISYAPMTQAMFDRRNAIAKALGYVLPEKCTLCNIHGDNGRRHDCWERPDEYTFKDGSKASSFHHMFSDDLSRHGSPSGTLAYYWPEDVEKAAYAIDKRKPLKGDPKDAEQNIVTQASLDRT